jgi:RsiW-degrading membrane proteinase PrsW (M82 family)
MAMATTLASDVRREDWTEPRAEDFADSGRPRAEWLWTLVGLALLGAFLSFVVVDYPLRTIIAGN